MTTNEDIIDIDSLIIQYQDTIMRLRFLQFKLEDRLQSERGLQLDDAILFLHNKYKQAIKTQKEQEGQQQSSNLRNNNDVIHFNHFQ